MTIATALIFLGGLVFVLALLLVIANRLLYVYEDPRIDQVEDLLPHANCGACGFPGCRPFAESLVAQESPPANCTVSTVERLEEISELLGVALGESDKKVARLACAGGKNVALSRAEYKGVPSCQAAALVSGGGKACFWGCLGYGDCFDVCDFDAIKMDAQGIPQVDTDKCTACGDCVEICPKDLFSLQPMSRKLWVACKNLENGDEVLEDCLVGCTACGKCAMDAPGSLIEMVNDLPKIDYSQDHRVKAPIERCPTGAIVWFDEKQGVIKGKESKKILRTAPRKTGYS